jgi:hypothetical protein
VRRPGNPMLRYLGGAALGTAAANDLSTTPAQEKLNL